MLLSVMLTRRAQIRNAKTWQIEYIDGRIEIVKSIHSWIVSKNYSKSGIYNMRAGKWKKYKDIKSISIIVSNPETVVIGVRNTSKRYNGNSLTNWTGTF